MDSENDPKKDFIGFLERRVKQQDRGALADLRRGLGKSPGTAMEMHRHVVPYLSRERFWEDDVFYLVAALFAYWHQGKDSVAAQLPENLGSSLSRLVTPETGSSLELRFTALLKSHRDDLPVHLRHTVGLLKSKEVPVHWRNLFRDLRHWEDEDGWVQRAWARSFWGAGTPREAGAVETEENDKGD